MDDWDRFENREYTDTAEPPHKKPREKRDPKYVTMKSFVIALIVCIIVSAAVGAGAYALAISHFGGTSIDKSVTTTNYNLAKATGSELSIHRQLARSICNAGRGKRCYPQ